MIVSTSDNSDPARINFRMLRTDSLEKKHESLRARSASGRSCARDSIADLITNAFPLECRLGQKAGSDHAGHPKIQTITARAKFRFSVSAAARRHAEGSFPRLHPWIAWIRNQGECC